MVCSDGLIHSFHWVFHRNCEKSPGFPTMFSTFSTEFSTFSCEAVYTWCIVPRGSLRKSGKLWAFAPFFRKKVNPENLLFTAGKNPLIEFLPVGMKEAVVFHTHFLQKSTCGKQRENLSFQQTSQSPTATAPLIGEPRSVLACPTRKQQRLPPLTEVLQLKKRPRPFSCERFSTQVTSYSGTRPARSGSTGSSCRHPRWW